MPSLKLLIRRQHLDWIWRGSLAIPLGQGYRPQAGVFYEYLTKIRPLNRPPRATEIYLYFF